MKSKLSWLFKLVIIVQFLAFTTGCSEEIIDSQKPLVSIQTHTFNEKIMVDSSFVVSISVEDESEIRNTKLLVDGNINYASNDNRDSVSFKVKENALPIGHHSLMAVAEDVYGNIGTSEIRSISIVGRPPQADFTISEDTIFYGEEVEFEMIAPSGTEVWKWIFGDGSISTEANPTHVYENRGSFDVSLEVKNAHGRITIKKNSAVTVLSNYGSVKDIDDNSYRTKRIGDQIWMIENLKVTRYADGSAIPIVEDSALWVSLTEDEKAYCWYDNDITNKKIFGGLYNWSAAVNGDTSGFNNVDIQGVCPDGWHLPNYDEWHELCLYLGDWTAIGGKLKSVGTYYWLPPNYGATNESGFSVYPGGDRYKGEFRNMYKWANFWGSSKSSRHGYADFRDLHYLSNSIGSGATLPEMGMSVRCVKN